jgi:hypothetical protein
MSQFKISDDVLSNFGSEISMAHSALLTRNLETIKELPRGQNNKNINSGSLESLAKDVA